MRLLDYSITIPTQTTPIRIIPFGCVHAETDGFHEGLWRQCVDTIARPHTYAIGCGDYLDAVRATARITLQKYRAKDQDKWESQDAWATRAYEDFYSKYLHKIRDKIICLAQGNHFWEFGDGTTSDQYLCRLAGCAYGDKPTFIRLAVNYKGKTLRTFKILVHHGDWSQGYARMGTDVGATERKAEQFDAFDVFIFSHCFDDQTEILTPDGWKRHTALETGSVVATYNREKDSLEWQRCESVSRYTHFKEMLHLRGSNVDLAVTAGHGLWVAPYYAEGEAHRGVWREMMAEEAFGRRLAFYCAAEDRVSHLPLPDAWIRLLAWIMAEGYITRYRGETTHLTISQSDAPDGRLQKLLDCVTACGLSYTLDKRRGYEKGTTGVIQGRPFKRNFDAYAVRVLQPSTYRDVIKTFLGDGKTPSRGLAAMSGEQARVFLETYVWADGSLNREAPNSRQVAAKRKDHIDFLQELTCKAGYRSSISSHSGMYYLTLNTKNTSLVRSEFWSKEPYEGVAWCPTVPNGTVIVRRNGKTCVTLNTHRRYSFNMTPSLDLPTRGELRLVERPRVVIRTGCFTKSYDQKCLRHYAHRKLLPPTELGHVELTIQFYFEHSPERYQRRVERHPESTSAGGQPGNIKYKFSVKY